MDRLLPPPDYVRRHLVEHAAAGGVLDERLLTPTFLPYVDVARLRGLVRQARVAEQVGWLTAWRQVAHLWRWEAPAANRAALEVAAAALGVPAAQGASSSTAWRVRWAAWPLMRGGEVIAVHEHPVAAVALASFEGRLVLATGSWDQTARLWDATTGEPLGPPLRHDGIARTVALGTLDGRLVLATGSWDTVRLWDPVNARQLVEPLPLPGTVSGIAAIPSSHGLAVAIGGAGVVVTEVVGNK